MIDSAETLAHGARFDADVCIVGAGACGIALARELAGGPARVALVESGGAEPHPDTQALCEGENVGLPYYGLAETRFRGFGGSTNRWGSWCRPLDAHDFVERPDVAAGGWPFTRETLDPYYARAATACGVAGPDRYDGDFWAAATGHRPVLPTGPDLHASVVQMRNREQGRSFASLHGATLGQAANVNVLLHATATELLADETGTAVERLALRMPSGKVASVAARLFVLAAGGMDNPRLLLLSRTRHPAGLGNAHDLVGRFFMEHPHITNARLVLARPRRRRGHLDRIPYGQLALRYMYHLSPARQARERLANLMLYLEAVPPAHRARLPAWPWRTSDAGAITGFTMSCMAEQLPNRESRVRLSTERDALGQPRVALDWRLVPQDRASIVRTLHVVGEVAAAAGLGRVEIDDDDVTWSRLHGGHHHMGTTRMHADPTLGVVDPDARVHGLRNLFVAGCSVFPTSGCSNPTLTAVALSLRLADHLRARLDT